MTTNGSLLTENIVEYLQFHKVQTTISLDGPRDVNDKNRVFINGEGTFQTVMSRIKLICEKYPDYKSNLLISMVIDMENDFDSIVKLVSENAFLQEISILSTPIDHNDETIHIRNHLESDKEALYRYKWTYNVFLSFLYNFLRLSDAKKIFIGKQTISYVKNKKNSTSISAGFSVIGAPGGPCLPGQMRLFINVDGDFFLCERVSELSRANCIGTVYDGFNYAQAEKILNVSQLTALECKDCWAFHLCSACVKMADDGKQLSAEVKRSHCSQICRNARHTLRSMILMEETRTCYGQTARE